MIMQSVKAVPYTRDQLAARLDFIDSKPATEHLIRCYSRRAPLLGPEGETAKPPTAVVPDTSAKDEIIGCQGVRRDVE